MVFSLLLPLGCNESTKSPSAATTAVAGQGVPEAATKCDYSLVSASQGEEVKGPEGKVYKVIPGVAGNLDRFLIEGEKVRLAGWAAEVGQKNHPVVGVVVFVDGKCVGFAATTIERPDVAEHFGNTALKMTGFDFKLPLMSFKNTPFEGFRVIALTKDQIADDVKIDMANQGENKLLWMKTTTPK